MQITCDKDPSNLMRGASFDEAKTKQKMKEVKIPFENLEQETACVSQRPNP